MLQVFYLYVIKVDPMLYMLQSLKKAEGARAVSTRGLAARARVDVQNTGTGRGVLARTRA